MSSTWATRLAADDGHNLRLYVTIQGIPNVFQEDAADVPTVLEAAARPRTKLVTKIEQSETRLNLARRRVEGGQLTIRLDDDDTGALAALFAPRARRRAFCTPGSTAASATIGVSGTTGLASSGTVYIEGETVTYSGLGAGPTLTGCTRGAFGSIATAHLSDTGNDGDGVFIAPPSWEGRRVYLTGYFVNDDGTTTAALTTSLGVFRLSAAPKKVDDFTWELTASDLVEEFATKKIGGGLFDVPIPSGTTNALNGSGNLQLVVGAGVNFNQFVIGLAQTHVLVSTVDGFTRLAALFSTSAGTTIEYECVSGPLIVDHVRHSARILGAPAIVAPLVLASRLGDAANGANDVLPGYDSATFGEGSWRLGAGILAAEIDTASFAQFISSQPWSYIIDEETDLADFMFEFCFWTESLWLASRAGKLKVVSLNEDGAASVITVDRSLVDASAPVTLEYDESSIYPRARVECNYDIGTKKYLVVENFFDAKMQKRFQGREEALDIKLKSLFISGFPNWLNRPTISQEQLQGMMRTLQVVDGRGRAYIHAVCHLPLLVAELGDIVTLNGITALDGAGGTTLTNQLARVTSMRPRYDDAVVDVTFLLLEKMHRVAPAALITSKAAGVLTLVTTGPETASTTPGRMFADGAAVQVWDVSAGAKVSRTVLSHTDTTVTVSSDPGFVIEAGVDFIRLDAQTASIDFTSQDGFTGLDFVFEMPNDENDGTAREVTRWR